MEIIYLPNKLILWNNIDNTTANIFGIILILLFYKRSILTVLLAF